ncbi:MAG: aminotransferase class V-fold PLP-dependent enzyme [Clostridiales bacterium]
MNDKLNEMYEKFGVKSDIIDLIREVESDNELKNIFDKINRIKEFNQLKVINAMQECNLSESHFQGTTGYGYGDVSRSKLDEIYSKVFSTDDSIVRHTIVSGTQALYLCLIGLLRPNDELLSVTGKPYDTLEEVIGIRGKNTNSLKSFNIGYRQAELNEDGSFNLKEIEEQINKNTKLVYIQRSMGYSWRKSIFIEELKTITKFIKSINNKIIILVDNCYGEFVEEREPTDIGVDLIAGSLIKNPGGGLAPTGGYICGKREIIEKISYTLTAPGIGKEIGPSLGINRLIFQGLFMAPHAVGESLKGAVFTAKFMNMLGFDTLPNYNDKRSDIIQAVKFNDKEKLINFCKSIQKSSAVDSFVNLEPWDMPGYDSKVIMAAGTFVQGASIELSADAPIKEPFISYIQGGLVYEHVKLAVALATQLGETKK